MSLLSFAGFYRVLRAIITNIDRAVAAQRENLPTPARPIVPLQLRPTLLLGVAIVKRAGSEILRMLSRQMMGENRSRFDDAANTMIAKKLYAASFQPNAVNLRIW